MGTAGTAAAVAAAQAMGPAAAARAMAWGLPGARGTAGRGTAARAAATGVKGMAAAWGAAARGTATGASRGPSASRTMEAMRCGGLHGICVPGWAGGVEFCGQRALRWAGAAAAKVANGSAPCAVLVGSCTACHQLGWCFARRATCRSVSAAAPVLRSARLAGRRLWRGRRRGLWRSVRWLPQAPPLLGALAGGTRRASQATRAPPGSWRGAAPGPCCGQLAQRLGRQAGAWWASGSRGGAGGAPPPGSACMRQSVALPCNQVELSCLLLSCASPAPFSGPVVTRPVSPA